MEQISCCLERPTFTSSFITQAIILAASAIKLNMFSCSICFRQTFTRSLWLRYTCTISQPIFPLIFSHHTLNSRGTRLPKKKPAQSCDVSSGHDNKPSTLSHQQHPLKDIKT